MNSTKPQINEQYLLRIFAKVNKLNNVPSQSKPILIIKYGPPASGKGSAGVRQVIESFNYPSSSYININVDDVVESIKKFKNNSRKVLNNKGLTTAEQINNLLNKATNENAKRFSKAYVNTRFNKNLSIPKQMDLLLQNAVNARKNITFETTGATGFPFWLFKYINGLEKYDIRIIFPLVECSEGWRRYKKRPTNSYLRGNVFRFGVSKRAYAEGYIKSYNEFLKAENILKKDRKFSGKVKSIVVDQDASTNNPGLYRPAIRSYVHKCKIWARAQGVM